MLDNPDPRPGHHEHLFLHDDVQLARSMAASWTPAVLPKQCQLGGGVIDLMAQVAPMVTAYEDQKLPPVRGQWSRRSRPEN